MFNGDQVSGKDGKNVLEMGDGDGYDVNVHNTTDYTLRIIKMVFAVYMHIVPQ